jgi:hypothetical protein
MKKNGLKVKSNIDANSLAILVQDTKEVQAICDLTKQSTEFTLQAIWQCKLLGLPINAYNSLFWNYQDKPLFKTKELQSYLVYRNLIKPKIRKEYKHLFYWINKKFKEQYKQLTKDWFNKAMSKLTGAKKEEVSNRFEAYVMKIFKANLTTEKLNEDYIRTDIRIPLFEYKSEVRKQIMYDKELTIYADMITRSGKTIEIQATVRLSQIYDNGYLLNKDGITLKKAWNKLDTMMYNHAIKTLVAENAISPYLAGMVDSKAEYESDLEAQLADAEYTIIQEEDNSINNENITSEDVNNNIREEDIKEEE